MKIKIKKKADCMRKQSASNQNETNLASLPGFMHNKLKSLHYCPSFSE